jgi:hypothetical protein
MLLLISDSEDLHKYDQTNKTVKLARYCAHMTFPIYTHTLCLVASALQDLVTGRVLPAMLASSVDVNPAIGNFLASFSRASPHFQGKLCIVWPL